MKRIKISASLKNLFKEINFLLNLDQKIQRTLRSTLTKNQMSTLTEGIFFSAYTAFQVFLEEIFILYTQEKPNLSNKLPKSHIKPRNFDHAYEIIKSSMLYLDWTSPDIIKERAEIYLKNGAPIKNAIVSNRVILSDLSKLRNHIAHKSKKSFSEYKKLLRKHYGFFPLSPQPPGEFLLTLVPNISPPNYYLVFYLENLKSIAEDLTH